MIVSTPRQVLWAFLNTRLDIPWSDDFRAIGVVRGGCLQAVVGYNAFTGRTCAMHSAIDDPSAVDRTFVRAIFSYPFEQLGLKAVFAMVDSTNERALDIDLRLGFKQIHRLEAAGLEGDLLILQMLPNECRWINGKEKRTRRS